MSTTANSPEAVAFELAEALLKADGKYMHEKGGAKAASRAEVAAAYEEAASLINIVFRQR